MAITPTGSPQFPQDSGPVVGDPNWTKIENNATTYISTALQSMSGGGPLDAGLKEGIQGYINTLTSFVNATPDSDFKTDFFKFVLPAATSGDVSSLPNLITQLFKCPAYPLTQQNMNDGFKGAFLQMQVEVGNNISPNLLSGMCVAMEDFAKSLSLPNSNPQLFGAIDKMLSLSEAYSWGSATAQDLLQNINSTINTFWPD